MSGSLSSREHQWMCGLGLVSCLAPVTAVQRLQVASRSAVRQEQRSCSRPWACYPALTGSGHSLTHPAPPVPAGTSSPHMPQAAPGLCTMCSREASALHLDIHPWLSAKGLCLPPLPWGHLLMLCVGNCCRKRLGVSRNVTQMLQEVVLPLSSKPRSRNGGCCLHNEGGNVGSVGRRLDCSQLLSCGPCELEICFSSLCASLCWPEHHWLSFQ